MDNYKTKVKLIYLFQLINKSKSKNKYNFQL